MTDLKFIPMLTKNDADLLASLAAVVWREVFTPIIGCEQVEYMLSTYQSADRIWEEIKAGARYFLVEYENNNVGYTAYDIRPEYLFISKAYLLSSVRGRGIGGEMLSWLENVAKTAGKDTLHLHVNRYNTRAVQVYTHLGYKIVKTCDTQIDDSKFLFTDYYMEKVIDGTQKA